MPLNIFLASVFLLGLTTACQLLALILLLLSLLYRRSLLWWLFTAFWTR